MMYVCLPISFRVIMADVGDQFIEEGKKKIPLPPVILATYGQTHNPKRKTVCVYGHYDVQPARKDDGWSQDPFQMYENELQQLIGRGTSDDKGPTLAWIWVLKAYRELGLEFPVNLKMVFEGMEGKR
jgi:acetylornithine deacetylase/succinyl-diaminopimelate desuccinylase-like protein